MSVFKKKQKVNTKPDFIFGYDFAFDPLTKCSHQALICAFKGLLIFSAAFGSIGSVISSFSLPCHLLLIALLFLVFSVGMAFMHYNQILFNVCYPLVFFAFAYLIFQFRYQVNSGFQAFVSIMQQQYSDYYELSIYREVHEAFSDRTMTITFAAVFIGFFFCLMLNIAISEYMSLFMVFLMTFPLLQLGIFIRQSPDLPYLILLLFSYFTVYMIKQGGHFLLPYREKKKSEFRFLENAEGSIHRYHASGKIIAQITTLLFVFCLICGVIWLPFSALSSTDQKKTKLRKKADEVMQIYVQNGLSGFFNRYDATGGISEGKLGGVSGVRPDYETDLTVTFAPFAYEPLYLKAYSGSVYTGNAFLPANYDIELLKPDLAGDYEKYNAYTAFLESHRLAHYTNDSRGLFAKMEIKNIDANANCLYYPYYTFSLLNTDYTIERSVIQGSIPIGASYQLRYYPLMKKYWRISSSPDELISSLGEDHIYTKWIQYYDMQNVIHNIEVPQEAADAIDALKDEIGSSPNTNEQIALIKTYLADNYSYSMSPGTTPRDADFVAYFLTEQKKGYCAHFAAAATLLLRRYGIPARYVEGYCIPLSEISEGTALSEKYEDWIEGDNPLGQTGVIEVNVTDANAHAWVEAYISGIGWVPYEFTPPSDEEDEGENYSSFWNMFSGIFRPMNGDAPKNDSNKPVSENNYKRARIDTMIKDSFLLPLMVFLACACILCLFFVLLRVLLPYFRRNKAYRNGDFAPLLSFYYQKISSRYYKLGLTDGALLPQDFSKKKLLHQEVSISYEQPRLSTYMLWLETCFYSSKSITKKEADELLLFLKIYNKKLRKYYYKCKR